MYRASAPDDDIAAAVVSVGQALIPLRGRRRRGGGVEGREHGALCARAAGRRWWPPRRSSAGARRGRAQEEEVTAKPRRRPRKIRFEPSARTTVPLARAASRCRSSRTSTTTSWPCRGGGSSRTSPRHGWGSTPSSPCSTPLRRGASRGPAPGDLEDAFYFSVQTFATIGYGAMSPATRFGHAWWWSRRSSARSASRSSPA